MTNLNNIISKTAERLEEIRKASGISIEEVSTAIQVSKVDIGELISGKSAWDIVKLADYTDLLGTNINEVLRNLNFLKKHNSAISSSNITSPVPAPDKSKEMSSGIELALTKDGNNYFVPILNCELKDYLNVDQEISKIYQQLNQKNKKFVSLFSNPIAGKTVVVVGTGALGGSMIKLLAPLGAKIIGVNKKGGNVEGCLKVVTTDKIDSVLPEADFLYLALPETPETKNLINRKRLDLLRSSCGIVNIGRQSTMDYNVLCEKLNKNELAGAILDVFTPEPIESNSKLWDTPNLVITPHVSADDGESYVRLTLELFIKNLELFIANKPLVNQIDKKLGY